MICGSGESKSRLAKAAGAEPAGQMRDEKLHAVVARSTFPSQNVQNTPAPDHFWHLRCRKSARRCGAKHISKSKCTKHTSSGPLLALEMSKKCTPLWREAHFRSQNVQNTPCLDHFWKFQMSLRFTTLHYITLHYTPLHYTTGHYTTLHSSTLHYTTLHSSTLHYAKLHYTTLHYTTLRSTTLHYITLKYTTLHYTTLHYTTLSSTTLHYLTLHYTPLHYNYNYKLHNYTPLHSTTLNYTTLYYTTLHSATLRYTTLHYTTLHYTE